MTISSTGSGTTSSTGSRATPADPGVTQIAKTGYTRLDIPHEPDFARMRREVGARLHAAMAEQGVDAVVLLGNGNVTYATGISWPLADAGLSHVEQEVAQTLVLRQIPVGACQQNAEVGMVGAGVPDLLSVEDPLAIDELGSGTRAC